jgi:hypothetical protein
MESSEQIWSEAVQGRARFHEIVDEGSRGRGPVSALHLADLLHGAEVSIMQAVAGG